MKEGQKCPRCSDSTERTVLYFGDGKTSPLQWRCRNQNCPCHRDPSKADEYDAALQVALGRPRPVAVPSQGVVARVKTRKRKMKRRQGR